MAITQTGGPASGRPLRLWPGVAAAVLLSLVRYVLPIAVPDTGMIGMAGALLGVVAIVLWWAFFSRAPHPDRWGALALAVVSLAAAKRIVHPSIATGMMGMLYFLYAIPVLSLAFVVWAVASRRLSSGPRRAAMVATIVLACGGWVLVRTNGVSPISGSEFAWRWSATAEQRLLAQTASEPAAPAPAPAPAPAVPEALPAAPAPPAARRAAEQSAGPAAEWPGFRGPHRDSVVPGLRIAADWSKSPPVRLWRRPVGPGWSSFAVRGSLIYTQEQRGNDEVVACYNIFTGQPVWKHRDTARFWESNAGPGPRATPALEGGRVYTLGATGILNALDGATGAVVWSRNAASDAGKKIPEWGFSGSPLVRGDAVIAAVAGRLAAYDLSTGALRWLGPDGGGSYSSPHLLTIGGVEQIVLVSDAGATGVSPADGTALWKYAWPGGAILQPSQTADGAILIATCNMGGGMGVRRIEVAQASGGFTAEERWTSAGLKPYFDDFVVHNGHAYGFDGNILACIGLTDGKRKWKGGRYGNGQIVLLPAQDALLVLSEEGELALVAAAPDGFRELTRLAAIEGKTWNHPALAGDILLVRNGEEMAAFRMPVERR